MLETSRTRCHQVGPTFVFRFYCRGEGGGSDFGMYKNSLKTALNDALLLFLSDYMTRIDSGVYMRRIDLKKKPPSFRVINKLTSSSGVVGGEHTSALTAAAAAISGVGGSSIGVGGSKLIGDVVSAAQQLEEQEKLKLRKRHKSTGHEAYSRSNQMGGGGQVSAGAAGVLKMNKSALDTKLGQVLFAQNIRDENQLNDFIIGINSDYLKYFLINLKLDKERWRIDEEIDVFQ